MALRSLPTLILASLMHHFLPAPPAAMANGGCVTSAGMCEDPRFISGETVTFHFHGRNGGHYCLLSDPGLHINAHFSGRRDPDTGRDLTWLHSIAVLFGRHRIHIGAAGSNSTTISLDGAPFRIRQGAKRRYAGVSIEQTNGPDTVLEVDGVFKVGVRVRTCEGEEGGCFFPRLDVWFVLYSLTNDVHGVLGQAYREGFSSEVEARVAVEVPVAGVEGWFASSGMYAADCRVARFGRHHNGGGAPVRGDVEFGAAWAAVESSAWSTGGMCTHACLLL